MSVTVRFFDNSEKMAVPLSNIVSMEGSAINPAHQRVIAVGSFVGVRASGTSGLPGDARRAVVIDCKKSPSGVANRKGRRG